MDHPETETNVKPKPNPPSQQLINQVNQLMSQGFELPLEKLVPTSTLMGDLGLDSLDAVDMLVYIEEKLGIKVDGERLRSLRTLQDVYVLAADAVANKATQDATSAN